MCPLRRFQLDAWNPEGYHTLLEPCSMPTLTADHVSSWVRQRHGCRACDGTMGLR
jgi:hypothetical protein